MANKTKIQWTDRSSNPIMFFDKDSTKRGWFCVKHGAGCANCYSEAMNMRLGFGLRYNKENLKHVEIVLSWSEINSWRKLRKPQKIFVCDMTDLFAGFIPTEFIDDVVDGFFAAPQHTFQVLTKRPDRARKYFIERKTYPANMWLGTSVSTQADADKNIPELLKTPAALRFVSCEPLLGGIDLTALANGHYRTNSLIGVYTTAAEPGLGNKLGWVICGGESGRSARPMKPEWALSLRSQCADVGVPFFMKQMGSAWAKENAPGDSKGSDMQYWPEELRVREMPDDDTPDPEDVKELMRLL